jgi:hypothetical protein
VSDNLSAPSATHEPTVGPTRSHRTLVVANRTAATPLLLEKIRRRAGERPTEFVLLIPDVLSRQAADWTLPQALDAIRQAARGPTGYRAAEVRGLVGGPEPLDSIKQTLADEHFDDVIISTLQRRRSEFLRRNLPRRIEPLGIPVTVITQPAEKRLGFADLGFGGGGPG